MLDTLPPVVQLFLREPPAKPPFEDLQQFRKYIKRLLPELRNQAAWTDQHFDYPKGAADQRIRGFVIRPSTGLDPFSHLGKCADPACRTLNAVQVARSIGLYGDTVLIADRFTSAFLRKEPLSDGFLYYLATQLTVLFLLRPLFEAGVFRFYRSARGFCEFHRKQFFQQIDEATDKVLDEVKDSIQYKVHDGIIEIDDRILHEPPLIFGGPLSPKAAARLKKGEPLNVVGLDEARAAISDEVFESFLDLQNASEFRAVTFSNSRVSLLTAQYVEDKTPSRGDLDVWEATRSAVLPWVRDLSVPQVVQLREEAAHALPRLRAALGAAMTNHPAESSAVKAIVRELQVEAEEVSAELKALKLPERERDRGGLGLLGMTLSIYGMAGDMPLQAMAVTGLISLLGLLHTTRRSDHQEHQRLVSRPGYVLVKAKELAEHA